MTRLGNKLAQFQRQYFTWIQSQIKKNRKILWLVSSFFFLVAFKLRSQINQLVLHLQMHSENFAGVEQMACLTSQSNQQT